MAKCPICNSRKGKRKCVVQEGFICTLCCGETRSVEKCEGCSYFKETTSIRNYTKVPHYPLPRMSNNIDLQDQANVIESAICQFDNEQKGNLNDNVILRIVEFLLNRYHFKDDKLVFSNILEENGFISIDRAIKEDLSLLKAEDVTKLLGTVYRSINRHTVNGREYLDFIHEYVGLRVGKGVRLIKNLF